MIAPFIHIRILDTVVAGDGTIIGDGNEIADPPEPSSFSTLHQLRKPRPVRCHLVLTSTPGSYHIALKLLQNMSVNTLRGQAYCLAAR